MFESLFLKRDPQGKTESRILSKTPDAAFSVFGFAGRV